MRYATWKLFWQPDARYGSGPEAVIAERGGSAEGAFSLGPDANDLIVGYIHGDISLDALDEWSMSEITKEEALALAQTINAEATINEKDRVKFPPPPY